MGAVVIETRADEWGTTSLVDSCAGVGVWGWGGGMGEGYEEGWGHHKLKAVLERGGGAILCYE